MANTWRYSDKQRGLKAGWLDRIYPKSSKGLAWERASVEKEQWRGLGMSELAWRRKKMEEWEARLVEYDKLLDELESDSGGLMEQGDMPIFIFM